MTDKIIIQKSPAWMWIALIALILILLIGGYSAFTNNKDRKATIKALEIREAQADSLLDLYRKSNTALADSMATDAAKSKLSSIATKEKVYVKQKEYKVKMDEIRDSDPSTYDTWLFLNGTVTRGMEFDSIAPYH